jgi:hypothetical protein
MSLATLANDEILRTNRQNLDLARIIEPHLLPIIDNLQQITPSSLRSAVKPIAAAEPLEKTPGANALDGLVKYIPTESITLYVAATAALSSLTATFPFLTPYRLYWGFVVLTPILFLLIYIGKRRSQNLPALPQGAARWPWWKLIASTIAFMVWALAVPPLVTTDAGKIVAAFGALLVSTMLSLVGGAVEPVEA